MKERITFLLNRAREKLWIKPLFVCVLSIAMAFAARTADFYGVGRFVPDIASESVETLLKIISASMLVIATFAVASMVSAYASASSTATPRAFTLVVADDVSQNALSAFIGAFIFSIVSLIAIQNSYYEAAGRFTLFVLTVIVFALVILTFVRWVDRIARLGRLGTTVEKVEAATSDALRKRIRLPHLGGVAPGPRADHALAVHTSSVGYVQRIDLPSLQKLAEETQTYVEIAAPPGTLASPGRVIAYVTTDPGATKRDIDTNAFASPFLIGSNRTFDDDPRFGLIVLSEIASRALSPGINDPGTAIDVIGTLVRLFALWGEPATADDEPSVEFDRVAVAALAMDDMFDDAFNAMARDGAGTIEVVIRLQKAFESLASIDNRAMHDAAVSHARRALARAEQTLTFPSDVDAAFAASRAVCDAER